MAIVMGRGDTRLIIDACKKAGLLRNQAAYVLATAWHETGATMKPVREGGGEAYLRSKPYYPFVGMGYVQLTWKTNYQDWSKRIGVDFVASPKLLLKPEYAVRILVEGMRLGTFTGKRLSNYITLKKSEYAGARRIVNGTDKSSLIAGYAKEYEAALLAEGYGVEPNVVVVEKPIEVPVVVEKPVVVDPGELEQSPAKSKTVWTWLLTAVATVFTTIANALGELDWRVQMFLAVVIVGFAAYGIKRRVDLYNAVKDLKAELQ